MVYVNSLKYDACINIIAVNVLQLSVAYFKTAITETAKHMSSQFRVKHAKER
jgi:hypothetical protein